MSLMRCPACDTSYGGPTMAAFACCPLCLAEHQRVEQLVYDGDSVVSEGDHAVPVRAGRLIAARPAAARRARLPPPQVIVVHLSP